MSSPALPSKNQLWLLVVAAAAILLITSGIRLSLGLFIKPIDASAHIGIVPIVFEPYYLDCDFLDGA